jgi:hypothetical protein
MKTSVASLAVALLLAACSSGGPDGTPGTSSDKATSAPPVERQYGKPADKVFDAALAAIKSFDLKVDVDRHDDLGGEIIARRADGRRVTANVASVDKDTSKVAVRADKTTPDVAAQIHERIAEKLGLGEAKAAFFGGNTLEGTYDTTFDRGLAAAERACKALGFVVTNRETHDAWAQLDARTANSTPVRFRMEPRDNHGAASTFVKFIAGKGKTDDSKSLASRMKAEFDRQTTLPAK